MPAAGNSPGQAAVTPQPEPDLFLPRLALAFPAARRDDGIKVRFCSVSYFHAFEQFLPHGLLRVLRTDPFDVSKCGVALIFGKVTQIFTMQTVP